ncbi:fimbrial protein [Winslowiella toletana]|uniref:fimbrial protein n=1 Tax=Winslowiella toletana TaxID=92490 RepID=UPI0028BF2E0D|nr:fimbrial protein [Winslowiella toletana]WNN46697.1 type 1 fimbrial protein [Winslowiella toletana]
MKLNKSVLVAVVALGMASMANAADQGHGKVTFTGSIIDAPCSIHPDSIDQTVNLGQVANSTLANGGKSTPRNFTVDLENCSFGSPATKNKVALTFTGMESKAKNGLLGITGTATGASVAITDGSGQVISLGKATNPQTLQDGKNTLSFAAYMQGDGASAAITEGDFQAVADFTLAYN